MTPVISGDEVFSHVFIGASDVKTSEAFYNSVFAALGIKTSVLSVTTGYFTDVKSQHLLSHAQVMVKRHPVTG